MVFCLFSFYSITIVQKFVDFSRIRTQTVKVEGEHADHLTTTLALHKHSDRSAWLHDSNPVKQEVNITVIQYSLMQANLFVYFPSMTLLWRVIWSYLFLKNGPSPASFQFIFGLFQTNINTILHQINVKKCPSSIQCWDSNPRPSEHVSAPITTGPGQIFS